MAGSERSLAPWREPNVSPVATSRSAILTDPIIGAVSRLFAPEREPSHAPIEELVRRTGLSAGDPGLSDKPVGKEKRVRQVLSWAIENEPNKGAVLVGQLLSLLKGCGGFRPTSENYIGQDSIQTAQEVFRGEGYGLGIDGDLRPLLLDDLAGPQLTDALRAYVRRAQLGAADAALVTGTGKDLLEATAAQVLLNRFGSYPETLNFPTLLGQAFTVAGLATSATKREAGEPPIARVERAFYELGCAVNALRNKEGTGHGRPFLPSVSSSQAEAAVRAMGTISRLLLDCEQSGT